jgi:SWI/SNF-related matrix-associated actin-dependent regulator of chromatin subfamily A3
MGLGKTCTMLSLIALNPCPKIAAIDESNPNREIKSTLIVVPFSLLQVWEYQILQHFRPSTIQVCSYYGTRRHQFVQQAHTFDIVITSYNTVAMEWKSHKSVRARESRSLLFSSHWHRIVLDEGKLHMKR